MSVVTTADEKILEAKKHLSNAYKCILEVLDEDCWGHEQFKATYKKSYLKY